MADEKKTEKLEEPKSQAPEAAKEAGTQEIMPEAAKAESDQKTEEAPQEQFEHTVSGLLGRKVGMTQIYDKDGNQIPVTVVETGPCIVLEIFEQNNRLKLGFEDVKEKRIAKAQLGYFKKLSVSPLRHIKEFRSSDVKGYKVGQKINVNVFKPGDYVDVTGTSVGKGFAGGMKRWGWGGGPAGHGSMHHRRVGSINSCADPSRTYKGRTMPGHMGSRTKTVQGLRVMGIDQERNLLIVDGAVPGSKNGLLTVIISRKKKWRSLDEKKAVVEHKVNPMKQSKAKAGGKGKK